MPLKRARADGISATSGASPVRAGPCLLVHDDAARTAISVGQHSDKGRKETNQDFHGALIPDEPLLGLKGIAVVLADGISSSDVSQHRQRIRRQELPDRLLLHVGFLVGEDVGAARASRPRTPGCTRRPGEANIAYDKDRGYVCTFSAMVIKVDDRAYFPYRRLPASTAWPATRSSN